MLDCEVGTLILHLGMSGSLRLLGVDNPRSIQPIKSVVSPDKHDHFDLILDNQTVLRFRDPRRFGAVLWQPGSIKHHRLFVHLGPEPLSEAFSAPRLYENSRGRKTSIKGMIMNNQIVVGVGNIYANEALFHAKINPQTAAGRIGLSRYKMLVPQIKSVLEMAIEAGGSSLRDFVKSDGNPGYFQQQYWVYGRSGKACKKCGTVIRQIKQAQRSSFYCPACQRR